MSMTTLLRGLAALLIVMGTISGIAGSPAWAAANFSLATFLWVAA